MDKMKLEDLTMEILIKVADDLNKLFEQPIKTGESDTDMALLQRDLIEAGNELQKEDEISDESKEVLALLGVKLPWAIEEEESPSGTDMPPNLIEKSKTKAVKAAKTTAKAPKKEVKKAEPKAAKAEKPKVAKVEKAAGKEKTGKDEFGFSIGSQSNLFVNVIKEKPMTMAEIKQEKWNSKNGTYYSVWKRLQELKVGVKTEDGKMSIPK